MTGDDRDTARLRQVAPQRRLHHVALGARDPVRVAAFYRDQLGLPEVGRHRGEDGRLRSVWLDLGGAILMIERTGEPGRNVRGVGAGPFLLAVGAARDQLAEAEGALLAAGFPVESRTEHTIYLRDPEGNRVALSSYPLGPKDITTKQYDSDLLDTTE